MDGFQTFSTGNRKKFVDQAKKKKTQLLTKTSLNSQQIKAIKIQSSIRKFLATSRYFRTFPELNLQSNTMSTEQISDNLRKFMQHNSQLFNRLHKMAIIKAQEQYNTIKSESQSKLQNQLAKYSNKVAVLIESLSKNQIKFWLKNILKYSSDFSLQFFNKKQQQRIFNIITQTEQQFIQLISCIAQPSLIYELISLTFCYPIEQKNKKTTQIKQYKRLQMNTAFKRINQLISNKQIKQMGEYPLFLISVLSRIINNLVAQCQLQIMRNYKIDPIYLKVEGDLLEQVINQKQQWQCFMDYLNIFNVFNVSTVHWFINMDSYEDSVKLCQYISLILRLIPLEYPLKFTINQLIICLTKISNWIKLHEIATNEDQQTILLPYLYIINNIFFRLTDNQFIAFAKKQKETLERMLKDKFIKILYKVILNQKINPTAQQISKICVNLLQQIYNKIFRTNVLSNQIFVNQIMSKKLLATTFVHKDNEIAEFLHKFPFIFSLYDRAKKFSQMLRNSHYYAYIDDDEYDNHDGQVKVRRGYQFQDAFNYLYKFNMKRNIKVVFINQFGQTQKGVDAGGLTKELINRVLKAAFKPQFGMFVQNSEKQLIAHPNKASSDSEQMAKYYEFIGKMIGKALYESITIGPKFCGPFLNAIIGKKNNFDDLRKIDKQLYNSLTYIKTMEENAQDLFLTFQYKDQTTGKYVNLKKQGHKIKVTNQNKDQYVSLLANYKVNKLLEFQSRNIRKGLKSVINSEWLFMFNYEELNFLISGSGQIKIRQLKMHTRYIGYKSTDETIMMFWKVVEQFDQQTKSNLLMFVTACPRPSFLGFQQLSPPFTILKKQDITALPVSHTCSNVLQLPDYKNQQKLEIKLKMAINSNSGFDIA